MEEHPSLAPGGEDGEERMGAWIALPRVEESLGQVETETGRVGDSLAKL